MRLIGELNMRTSRIGVWVTEPPSRSIGSETHWLYITKQSRDGSIARQSIGIGMSSLEALIKLLAKANADYCGPRTEFRATSGEHEQRTPSK